MIDKRMSTPATITRHSLIINKLRKRPLSLKEMGAYLAQQEELQGYKLNISPKTFRRDLDDIFSLYHIDIQYNKTKNQYYIATDAPSEASGQLLEAFDTFNALKLNEGISQYVHFEKRKPKGTENLYGLLHAIKNRHRIIFDFKDYWQDKPERYEAEPFGLKEFKNRWYVLAKNLAGGEIKRFALDRLTNLEITSKIFKENARYNVDKMYDNCFGIITPDDTAPSEIELFFDEYQANYINSLHLHASQETISDTEDGLQIKLRLFITHDFIMELLSYGDTVKVLKPEKLKEEIKNTLQKALGKYV